MKPLMIFCNGAVLLCVLIHLSSGSLYETIGKSLLTGVNGATTKSSHGVSRGQWGRSSEYDRYQDQMNQQQRGYSNQDYYMMNRNYGRMDYNRGDSGNQYDQTRWY